MAKIKQRFSIYSSPQYLQVNPGSWHRCEVSEDQFTVAISINGKQQTRKLQESDIRRILVNWQDSQARPPRVYSPGTGVHLGNLTSTYSELRIKAKAWTSPEFKFSEWDYFPEAHPEDNEHYTWITRLPYTVKSTRHPEYRQGDVYLADCSVGVVRSEYDSGWTPYRFVSMSALGDHLNVPESNSYQDVVQDVKYALRDLNVGALCVNQFYKSYSADHAIGVLSDNLTRELGVRV